MKRRNDLSLKKQFLEARDYIWESKWYIGFIFAIFVTFSIFGFVFVDQLGFLADLLRDILAQIMGLNGFELTIFIMQNNMKSAIYGLIFGVVFGILPIFSSAGNGLVLGYVAALTVREEGVLTLWRLLPHGIFELVAVFIALGMGLRLGMFMFSADPWKNLKEKFYQSINAFLLVVVPLLILAGIIEGILIAFA